MEGNLRGQFYMLSAFLMGMYIFFLLEMFTATTSDFATPDIPSVRYVHDAIQDELNREGSAELVLEALKYVPEPVGVHCSPVSGGSGCDLTQEEWYCGANVTVRYRGESSVEVTKKMYRKNFHIKSNRTAIYIYSNQTSNLVKLSTTVSHNGTLMDADGNPLRASLSGNTLTFRLNLIKNRPRVVLWYRSGSSNDRIFSNIGILTEGYDGSALYSRLSSRGDVENITLADLSELEGNAGPRVLFIPGEYPSSYGSALLKYVDAGGILVSYRGLCSTSCLVGNMEQLTDSHTLNGTGDFSSLNPIQTNSQYFTNPDEAWIVYGPALNTSRAAVGATAYGDGYVVFVGNQSMLTTWSQLDSFLNILLNWAMPATSTTIKSCGIQTP